MTNSHKKYERGDSSYQKSNFYNAAKKGLTGLLMGVGLLAFSSCATINKNYIPQRNLNLETLTKGYCYTNNTKFVGIIDDNVEDPTQPDRFILLDSNKQENFRLDHKNDPTIKMNGLMTLKEAQEGYENSTGKPLLIKYLVSGEGKTIGYIFTDSNTDYDIWVECEKKIEIDSIKSLKEAEANYKNSTGKFIFTEGLISNDGKFIGYKVGGITKPTCCGDNNLPADDFDSWLKGAKVSINKKNSKLDAGGSGDSSSNDGTGSGAGGGESGGSGGQ